VPPTAKGHTLVSPSPLVGRGTGSSPSRPSPAWLLRDRHAAAHPRTRVMEQPHSFCTQLAVLRRRAPQPQE